MRLLFSQTEYITFLKKSLKKDKINIITLGCSKNIVDSEILITQLKANNFEVKYELAKNDADIVIINTCGFIDKAKEESVNTILQSVEDKKQGLINKLYVIGCLSERYKDELEKEIPEVDKYFGVNQLPDILKELNADYKKELLKEHSLITPSHYAYLKISEGCNNNCSFCAIPLIKGRHKSKPIEDIIEEAKLLSKKGVKEIILVAQDLTYYGLDIYKKRNLACLLENLSEINGIEWIRLQYTYPDNFPVDVLKMIKEKKKICKYLDVSFQHINDKILKSMKRKITKKQITEFIDKARKEIPDLSLRTSFIVGYPDETEKDFQELSDFVKHTKFDRLGVFTYSHEENTPAYKLQDNVSEKIKQEREKKLMSIQQKISLELNKNKIGKTLKVIIDRLDGNYFIGRTEFDSPEIDNQILIKKDNNIKTGKFYQVRITKADYYDLYADLIQKFR